MSLTFCPGHQRTTELNALHEQVQGACRVVSWGSYLLAASPDMTGTRDLTNDLRIAKRFAETLDSIPYGSDVDCTEPLTDLPLDVACAGEPPQNGVAWFDVSSWAAPDAETHFTQAWASDLEREAVYP